MNDDNYVEETKESEEELLAMYRSRHVWPSALWIECEKTVRPKPPNGRYEVYDELHSKYFNLPSRNDFTLGKFYKIEKEVITPSNKSLKCVFEKALWGDDQMNDAEDPWLVINQIEDVSMTYTVKNDYGMTVEIFHHYFSPTYFHEEGVRNE